MSEFMDKLTRRQTAWEPLLEDSDLEQFFTDAEYAIQVFEELVTADRLLKRLLVIHGVGGVGKSTLLRMYRLSCYRRGIPVALVGAEDAPSSVYVLASWAEDLSDMGVRLRSFPKSLDHYRALQSKVKAEKAKEAMRGAAGELGKAVAKTAVEMAASTIPIIGPLATALGSIGTEAAIDWLRGFLSKPDLEFYLDPSKRLTDDFLADLTRAAARQRIVLMADTYEQMATLDNWMRDLAQRLPENVLLVIAGRAVPEWDRAWPGWMGHAKIVPLKEMTHEDQRTLVRRYYAYVRGGEPDPEQVEAIVRFARGLPMAATTVVQLWVQYGVEDFQEVRAQVVADLVDRLLEGVPSEIRPAFEVAAVLRYFNADSLRALLGSGDADALYTELRRWPFIRPRREGLSVHDTMREMMDEALLMRTPERYHALHERAAAYYGSQRTRARGPERERLTLELLYHSLRADESKGIDTLERLFGEAERLWHRELMQNLLKEAFQQVLDEPQHQHRLRHLQARMGKDWPERERLYKELLSEDLDESVRLALLRDLAESLAFQGKSAEARDHLDEALAICERLGNPIETAWTRLQPWGIKDQDRIRECVNLALETFRKAGDEYGMAVAELELGYDYLGRWQATEARDAFARSMALHEKLGNRQAAAVARERIGQAYMIEGDFRWAVASKEEALKVFEELQDQWSVAWTLDELSTCYSWTGQWELALMSLKRAQTIFAEWGDHRETACVVRQGEIYRKQGRFELALQTYQRALKMPEHNVWSTQEIYGGMGYIHLAHGEYEEALADFQQVIAEFRADGKELEARLGGEVRLGDLSLAQGRAKDAVKHYETCLDAARSINNYAFESLALIGMCRALYEEQSKLDQLDDLLGRAEELGKAYNYHQLLADTHILQGHMALDGAIEGRGQLAASASFYRAALEDALRYNHYKLDGTVEDIITHCHRRGVEGEQVLTSIRDSWQTDANDEEISLLEAERTARKREPGDGSPQVSVVEQIEQALKETENDRCWSKPS